MALGDMEVQIAMLTGNDAYWTSDGKHDWEGKHYWEEDDDARNDTDADADE